MNMQTGDLTTADVPARVRKMLRDVNELLRTPLPDPMYRTNLNAVRLHLECALGV